MMKFITVLYHSLLPCIFCLHVAVAGAQTLQKQSVSTSLMLDYSFAVVGCNRANPADTTGNPSTANVCQLNRLFSEVMGLTPRPDYLFITGDLIYGYSADTIALARQLTAWKGIYLAHPISSTSIQLIVLPGNHELEDAANNKKSFPAAERTWVRVMAAYIPGNNGPLPGQFPQDSLLTSQKQLSYSFDHKNDHFVILNTDPVGWDSHVPAAWIKADLLAARGNGVRHIFCLGHKPAYASTLTPGTGLKSANAGLFWSALENGQSEAMFAAHNHLWDKIQPHAGKTWQIIAGNAGSATETPWTNPYFGFSLVKIYTDGSVNVISYGHPITASNYTACLPGVTTLARDAANITLAGLTGIEKYNDLLNESFSVFPNPNNGNFTISIDIPKDMELTITLNDEKGKSVYKTQYAARLGTNVFNITTTNLSRGVYFMELSNGLGKAERKIVVQ